MPIYATKSAGAVRAKCAPSLARRKFQSRWWLRRPCRYRAVQCRVHRSRIRFRNRTRMAIHTEIGTVLHTGDGRSIDPDHRLPPTERGLRELGDAVYWP